MTPFWGISFLHLGWCGRQKVIKFATNMLLNMKKGMRIGSSSTASLIRREKSLPSSRPSPPHLCQSIPVLGIGKGCFRMLKNFTSSAAGAAGLLAAESISEEPSESAVPPLSWNLHQTHHTSAYPVDNQTYRPSRGKRRASIKKSELREGASCSTLLVLKR